jgi:hypothetical protein
MAASSVLEKVSFLVCYNGISRNSKQRKKNLFTEEGKEIQKIRKFSKNFFLQKKKKWAYLSLYALVSEPLDDQVVQDHLLLGSLEDVLFHRSFGYESTKVRKESLRREGGRRE